MTLKFSLKEKMQQFGAAMFVPVLLFSFAGLLVGFTIVFKDPNIVGHIANPDGMFYKIMWIMEEGGWMVFRNMPILFCLGIPIGLAKIAPERAVLVTLVAYFTFNYFIAAILTLWGFTFGVDYSATVGGTSGLTMIGGIKTLGTNIIGGIMIGAITTSIHNRFYEKKLPDYLGVFQGATYVYIIIFFITLLIAFLTAAIWPKFQMGINALQNFMASSGALGVWIYTFLERILIPTGLHHFIYGPFVYGPAVVSNGIEANWIQNVQQFVNEGSPLKELFPYGFALHGNSKVFGSPGLALAIWATARPENKRQVASLLIPATLTAVVVGITEPLEFTFLFIAPVLFLVHAILAASLSTILFVFGVVGNFGAGILPFITANWIFTFKNHAGIVFTHIIIGLIFTVIWFFIFRFIILKWEIKTPGREEDEESIKLYTKTDYEEKIGNKSGNMSFEDQARIFLECLGGATNIEQVSNCTTRLRVIVKDKSLIASLSAFKQGKAHGLVKEGTSVQVIVGLSVPQVRTRFEQLLRQ